MLVTCLLSLLCFQELDSCGPLSPNQAAIDALDMRLVLRIDPATETIGGFCETRYRILDAALSTLDLELVDSLKVTKVTIDGRPRPFKRGNHRLVVALAPRTEPSILVRIDYSGAPHVAKRPPWEGGFNWSRTDGGSPWVGVSCQGEGGQVWYPCKTHQSDKLEGVRLEITVPEPLYCASVGLLEKIEPAEPGWRTFFWETRYPIASYNVSVNIADYEVYEDRSAGFPVILYMLREYQKADQASGEEPYAEKIKTLQRQALNYLRVLGEYYGEYPFRDEKFGLAHTAYMGMEHQTINSYGAHFFHRDGLDSLMIHEMGHEWWGNKLTVTDTADFWLQEGLATYATGVYLEHEKGLEAALTFYRSLWFKITNEKPIVQGKGLSQAQAYIGDIYTKGALTIHALRWLVGRDTLNQALKSLIMDANTTYLKTASTADLIAAVERASGRSLDWFFQRYVYTAKAPMLTEKVENGVLHLSWDDPTFAMPLELEVTEKGVTRFERVELPNGKAVWPIPAGVTYRIDPRQWVYRACPTSIQ